MTRDENLDNQAMTKAEKFDHQLMTKEDLKRIKIAPIDCNIYQQVKYHMDHVAKPLDSLGVFEGLIAKIGAIQRNPQVVIEEKAVIVMCADNGIVAEGVSQSGQEVTYAVAKAMGKNHSSVGRMASVIGATVFPIDIGIASDLQADGVRNFKVRKGTRNFRYEPAMTEQETLQAIYTGIKQVSQCKKDGYQIIATGEMGIANTTTSTAIAASLLNLEPEKITGRGAGLDDQSLIRKVKVIKDAIEKYQLKDADAFTVLQTVGGLDIAGLTGVFIGGALNQIPVVIDGVISAVAAYVAEQLCKGVKEYMIPSHKSREVVSEQIMDQLQLKPVLDADMALGEGTGAVMMMSLLDMAVKIYHDGSSFESFEIEQYERFQ